jgi:PilZ domain
MSATERRHVPRTKLDKLAYIHIEPNNGGIVLNVSDDGLAFHSMAPVEKNGTVRFSLKEQNRRIDVCGELIWTDEIQKIGGLRFTTLTNEAREQLDDWINQPEPADERRGSSLGAAFLRAFPSLRVRTLVSRLDPNDRLDPLKMKVRLRMSGFSGGLATGLLISMLAGFIFVFSYAHRREFGETLIRLGQKLASKSPAEPASKPQQAAIATPTPPLKASSTVPQLRNPSPLPHEPKVRDTQTHHLAYTPAPPPTKAATNKHPEAEPDVVVRLQPKTSSQPAKLNVQPTKNAMNRTDVSATPRHIPPANTGEVAFTPPASTAPPSSNPTPKPAAIPVSTPVPHEPIGQIHAQSFTPDPALPLQMFFDLGKFKQQEVAQDLSDRVAKLGIRASVVSKGRLWMNSYQVLAGPYVTLDEEKKIHSDLVTSGIKARPFERGSRGFTFRSGLIVAGSKLPVGDFTISWETYVAEAKVKFVQAGAVLATTEGKWVTHPEKFAHNEYVYQNLGNGSRPLLEVHFAGLDRALVFR